MDIVALAVAILLSLAGPEQVEFELGRFSSEAACSAYLQSPEAVEKATQILTEKYLAGGDKDAMAGRLFCIDKTP